MEQLLTAPAPAPAAPAPAAPVAPAPVAATPAAPMVSAPSSSNSISAALKNMNWVEVGFGVLGTAALFYTIYYYRYNLDATAKLKNDFQQKLDELEIKLADVNAKLDAPSQQPQVFL